MLSMKLTELKETGGEELYKYVPKHEKISLDVPCKRGEGIWDILGYYDKKGKVITICDKAIQEEFENKFNKDLELKKKLEELSRTKEELILILREIVRLHEHSHAFLHTAEISGANLDEEWYLNLPEDVDEPLTEFTTYSIIRSLKNNKFMIVFLEFDKYTPEYYRNWRKIEEIVGSNITCDNIIYVIPIIAKFARERKWKSWEDFHAHLKEREQELKRELLILRI